MSKPCFKSNGWFKISGRGWIATTENDRNCDSFSHLIKHIIEIDGKDYFVTAVEFMGFTSYAKGGKLGLLIRGEK